MKLKKLLIGFSILCLTVVLFLPLYVSANENGTTTITTKVSDTHAVELVIEGNGTIKIGSDEYKISHTVQIPRLSKQTYQFMADDGWQLKSVAYGMKDNCKEVALNGTSFTAQAIHEDGNTLHVIFEKKAGTGIGSGTDGTNKDDNVQTGDHTNATLWGFLLICSTIAVLSLYRKK